MEKLDMSQSGSRIINSSSSSLKMILLWIIKGSILKDDVSSMPVCFEVGA